jgi:radical SAM protein with 4Fe4S-binding SPASM domain
MIELLRRLGYYPRICVWELTLTCDMRCRHCGSFAGHPRENELSPEEAQDVARQLVELRCERLTLSGGEPTLRKDWDCIAATLSRGGVKVNMISNGWSWTPDHTKRALDAGMKNTAFSLDGMEEAHDSVRAKPGSHHRVMAAIDDCVKRGLRVAVVSHVNALNKGTLPQFREELAAHGVRLWQVQIGNPQGNMASHQDLLIKPTDLLEIVPLLAEMRSQKGKTPVIFPADNVGYYGKYERALRDTGDRVCFWVGCRAGCQVIGIESNGNIKGCLSLPSAMHNKDEFVEGNLRQASLKDIWTRPGAFAFNRQFDVASLQGFCGTCRFADICRGGCSWSAFTRTGSRFDNPLCFYRVAVENKRWDLIPDAEVDQGQGDTSPTPGEAPRRPSPLDPGDPVPMG